MNKSSLPVISGRSALGLSFSSLEFLLAGASAVQVGTASFVTPDAVQRIVGEMER